MQVYFSNSKLNLIKSLLYEIVMLFYVKKKRRSHSLLNEVDYQVGSFNM